MAKKTIYDFGEKNKPLLKKRKAKPNVGFGMLKNPTLKSALENCGTIAYNKRKHTTIKELGYTGVHQLDMLGKKRWLKYFDGGGNVYLLKGSSKLDMVNRILFDKSISKYVKKGTPLPKEVKPRKRQYVKDSPSKVLGFNFYIQTNDKLKKRDRETLLTKGNNYFAVYNNNIELDNSLTDIEIVDEWNQFFADKGHMIPEFKDKLLKRFPQKDFGEESDSVRVGKIEIPTILKKPKNSVDF
jgi:hypothetical protein